MEFYYALTKILHIVGMASWFGVALAISIILSIAVVFDLSEKIDNFIDNDAPLKLIFQDYYVNFLKFHYLYL